MPPLPVPRFSHGGPPDPAPSLWVLRWLLRVPHLSVCAAPRLGAGQGCVPDLRVSEVPSPGGLLWKRRGTHSLSPALGGGRGQPRVAGSVTRGDGGGGDCPRGTQRGSCEPQDPDVLNATSRNFFTCSQDQKPNKNPKTRCLPGSEPSAWRSHHECHRHRFQVAWPPAQPPSGALLLLASPCPSSPGSGQPRKLPSVLLSFTSPARHQPHPGPGARPNLGARI